ncbi:MAG: DUF3375 domain-containing protein [Gammaproteobacteria bacterium]|nr:DUF3375 domain-containing protein [Gammaproteobacteria bacterium]
MALDYHTLDALRQNHPAWRLLNSPHAPLIASFLQRAFITPNVRIKAQADLVEALEDDLFVLREQYGEACYPKSAKQYLDDWAEPEKGWLHKFYKQDSDEVQFDLTPATEKVVVWLDSLSQRSFVGTESRLLTLFELLKQITEGSTDDPEIRLRELHKRQAEIEADIAQVVAGNIPILEDTAVKDRFMQFDQQARELLADFREVEYNFRGLDRSVRERIAQWEGSKGELLNQIMGERDAISDSDQGRSFQAFWDFLMSSQRQQEFTDMLQQVLSLSAVAELNPDKRTRRIHYDWLEAGEHAQRTVAKLSQQLRRFLDDQAWLENRYIMEILHEIEKKTLASKDTLFSATVGSEFMMMENVAADIDLPMERPLFKPPLKSQMPDVELEEGDAELNTSAMYKQFVVDKLALAQHVRQSLQNKSQVSLWQLCQDRPLQRGLAELVAYLELAGDGVKTGQFDIVVDDTVKDTIQWKMTDGNKEEIVRTACLPRIIYSRQLTQ